MLKLVEPTALYVSRASTNKFCYGHEGKPVGQHDNLNNTEDEILSLDTFTLKRASPFNKYAKYSVRRMLTAFLAVLSHSPCSSDKRAASRYTYILMGYISSLLSQR